MVIILVPGKPYNLYLCSSCSDWRRSRKPTSLDKDAEVDVWEEKWAATGGYCCHRPEYRPSWFVSWEETESSLGVDIDQGDDATYAVPVHGWTCFHCGETFRKYGDALLHFGPDPDARPACTLDKGVLIDLRAAEKRVGELQAVIDLIADRAGDYAYASPRLTVRDPETRAREEAP